MESTISHTFHTTVCELLKSLKFVDKKKSKKLKMYYESLQNYMYEYTSYVKLVFLYPNLLDKLRAFSRIKKLRQTLDSLSFSIQWKIIFKDEIRPGTNMRDLSSF